MLDSRAPGGCTSTRNTPIHVACHRLIFSFLDMLSISPRQYQLLPVRAAPQQASATGHLCPAALALTRGYVTNCDLQVDGFTAYCGGEDLKRAKAALSGALVGNVLRASLGSAAHNLEDIEPHTRELAFAAKQYAVACDQNPNNYDTLYNHGLVLYELASRVPARTPEQMSLLHQVSWPRAASLSPALINCYYLFGHAAGISGSSRFNIVPFTQCWFPRHRTCSWG